LESHHLSLTFTTFTKNWQGGKRSEESWNKFETEVEVSTK